MTSPPPIQQRTVPGFLADRAHCGYGYDRLPRCTGISSDALALYGTRGGPEPRPGQYPADRGDLAACERTYLMAPDEVRERMLPILERYREHVAKQWASRGGTTFVDVA